MSQATEVSLPPAPDNPVPPPDPLLDTGVRAVVAGVDDAHPYGRPGRPVSAWSPFRIAFATSIGVGLAYTVLTTLLAVREILLLAAFALVLALGLDRPVTLLARRVPRSLAVTLVVLALVGLFAGFAASVVPPISAQAQQLARQAPDYLNRLQAHNSTLAGLDARYHLVSGLRRLATSGVPVSALGGLVGVGKALLSAVTATLTVTVLLVYLLANLPGLKRGAYRLVPRSRRARVGLLSDEICERVGGYILVNFVTSLLAGLTAGVFLFAAGVPYPVALALFVAVADLIPLVGAGIGALVAAVVAFFVSLPVGLATVAFFVLYQVAENLVIARFPLRSVRVSPLVTLLAALSGGALLGVIGALVAIPLAAGGRLVLQEVLFQRQDRC